MPIRKAATNGPVGAKRDGVHQLFQHSERGDQICGRSCASDGTALAGGSRDETSGGLASSQHGAGGEEFGVEMAEDKGRTHAGAVTASLPLAHVEDRFHALSKSSLRTS